MKNKLNIKTLSKISFLAASCLISSVNATGTAAYNQPNSFSSAHAGKSTIETVAFWAASQNKQADYEAKMKAEIKANPDGKSAYANLAVLYLSNNKTRKSIDAFQEAINHDAENARLFAGLSVAYLHLSKYGMAKAMAEQAIAIDPSMKHAAKIKEYIIAKEEIIAQASKVSSSDVSASDMTSSKPDDINHRAAPDDSTHTKTTGHQ